MEHYRRPRHPHPPADMCVCVLLCSYRGYGQSEGKPNQRGLQLDAQAALDHLLSRDDINTEAVVVFGRSLGGAVALHLAADNQDKVGGLCVWGGGSWAQLRALQGRGGGVVIPVPWHGLQMAISCTNTLQKDSGKSMVGVGGGVEVLSPKPHPAPLGVVDYQI